MNKYLLYFDRCVDIICRRKGVDKYLIFTPSRLHNVCDCRVMIFNLVNAKFPNHKAQTQIKLGRKHPYYYHAERVHANSYSFDKEYRNDYDFCKEAIKKCYRKEFDIRNRITEAIEAFGDSLDLAKSFFVDITKAEIFVDGEAITYKHKGNSTNEPKR